MSELYELLLAAGDDEGEDVGNGIIRKEVLRTGTWAKTPGLGGVVIDKPLKIVKSDPKEDEIALDELVVAYDDAAFDKVTVPLTHEDRAQDNTGYIRGLQVVQRDEPGEYGLMADFDFTDQEIGRKARDGSIPDVSCGIAGDYVRKSDGKNYKWAIGHVCITGKSWIDKLRGWSEGVAASDDTINGSVVLELADSPPTPAPGPPTPAPGPSPGPPSGETVWDSDSSVNRIRNELGEQLREIRDASRSRVPFADGEVPYYFIRDVDVANSKVLITGGYGDNEDGWIAKFTVNGDDVELAPHDQWVLAKQEWVAASDEAARKLGQTDPHPAGGPPPRKVSLTDSPLALAQRDRKLRSTRGQTRGGRVSVRTKPLADLELSDEQKRFIENLERRAERGDQIEADTKESRVDAKLTELRGIGMSEENGFGTFLKEVRQIHLSDDGGPALHLSESRDGGAVAEYDLTATQIIDRLVAALPRDAEKKVALAQQVVKPPHEDPKPPENPGGEKTLDQRLADADADLGTTTPGQEGS